MRREGPADAAPLRALVPLLPYLARYRGRALAALAALTVASAVTLAVPLAVRRMIDHGFSESSAGLINNYFAAMIAIVAVLACASAARYYCVMTLGDRIVADLRSDLFRHLTRLDAAFYDRTKSGELVSRLTADTLQMKAAFGSSASVALRNLFMFVGAVVMMVLTSPKLSAFVLIAIPVIVLPLMASGRGVRRRSRRAQDVLADATSFAAESLGAVRIMQAFTAESGGEPQIRRGGGSRLRRRARCDERPRDPDRHRDFPCLQFGRHRAVGWRARCARWRDFGGSPVAIRAVCRAGGERARAALGSVERNLRRRGLGRADIGTAHR